MRIMTFKWVVAFIAYSFLCSPILQAARDVLLHTTNFESSDEEIGKLGGRTTHQLTDQVIVAHLPDVFSLEQLQFSRIVEGMDNSLSDASNFMVQAWRQSLEIERRLNTAISVSCSDPRVSTLHHISVKPEPTSERMTGKIALGIYIVSGRSEIPGEGPFVFSDLERSKIISEIMLGTNFLANAEPRANVSFLYYGWGPEFKPPANRPIEIKASPSHRTPSTPPTPEDWEAMEAPWRDAALKFMGARSPGTAGISEIVDDIKRRSKANWAYAAFFTKYPLVHDGYAGGQKVVISNKVADWPVPTGIHGVFAHETCHIFGAADEYNQGGFTCSCGRSGYFNIPNGNCINCRAGRPQEPCMMHEYRNPLELCRYSRAQIGWVGFQSKI